jgi:DNA-binding NtrC family response regulator
MQSDASKLSTAVSSKTEPRAASTATVRIDETTLRADLNAESTVVSLTNEDRFGRLIGASPEMRKLYPLLEKLTHSNVSVVIEGESGTGKDLLAQSLHELGPRAEGPFVVFDCTSVPSTLIESELFGHERGSFTGADATRTGVFEQAHGGTLLIDEIGELDPILQPKLLRALERSEVRRVGGSKWIHVDVRVLCATWRDLDREVQAERFRGDLFYRLAVARLVVPPLRQRRGDVRVLARAFARQLGAGDDALPEQLLLRWSDRPWSGNVRELRNAVARYLALGELDGTSDSDVGPSSARASSEAEDGTLERVLSLGLSFSEARQRMLREFERRYVERVLAEHGGNVVRAAAASGIGRRHLQRVRGRSSSESSLLRHPPKRRS